MYTELVQPLGETLWRFLRKPKIELPYDPAIPLLGIYPKKDENLKRYMHPMFIAALFTVAKTWEQPKYPLRGMDKEDVIYTYTQK